MNAIATASSSRPRAKNRVGVISLVDEKRVGARATAAWRPHWAFRDDGRESAVGSRSYLSPEPMLQRANFSAAQAFAGRSAPAYAYAFNNPIAFIDPDGNAGTREQFCAETGTCRLPDYCAQNPSVCNNPPPPAPPRPPGPKTPPGGGGSLQCKDPEAENVFECLLMCKAPIEEAEQWCRDIPDTETKKKLACWTAIYAGYASCQVFCRIWYGPPVPH